MDKKGQPLTPEQQARAEIVKQIEASEALEGYPTLSETDDYAYKLQQQWILGDIDSSENIELLKKHYGLK